VDRDGFERSILVYLDLDLPTVGEHYQIAAVLANVPKRRLVDRYSACRLGLG
jgi:hypothetical protein